MHRRSLPFATALLFLTVFPAFAQFGGGGNQVTAELISEASAIAPGKPFTVAVKMVHQDTWHTYWKNSGYIQFGPKIKWDLPDGFEAGDLQWPVPEKMFLQGAISYVYGHDNHLLAEITPPDSLAPGSSVEIKASARWQHCDPNVCTLGNADLALTLPVAAEATFNEGVRAELDKVRKERLPKPISGWKAEAYANPQGIQLVLTPDGDDANTEAEDVYFFSADAKIDGQAPQKLVKEDGRLILQMQKNAEYDGDDDKLLPGVLIAKTSLVKDAPDAAGFEINPALTDGSPPVGKAAGGGEKSIWIILVSGLIGGLILNLMPCVFPVIGLKIMGFVKQAGEDRRKVTIHGLVFTAGIIISFWVLAGIFYVITTQAKGAGWGFQLQNPWFVFALVLVMFILALNMAGVFEIGTSAVGVGSELTGKSGYVGSFFSGVLATVVATPCSAPFLGTALGAVASLSLVPFFATFTAIAIGLSLPYIVLSMFPDLVKKLPPPGAWMESFKQGMSFLLFGTAGYLIWAYDGLVEPANLLYAILGLTIIAFGFWIYGRWATPVRPKNTRRKAIVLSAVFIVLGAWLGHPKPSALTWEPWSPQVFAEIREAGEPVYIDFTARWCATCQTNKAAYKSEKIYKAVEEKGIRLLKADWTQRGPIIAKALQDLGEGAIPVNVLYIPGEDEPHTLPKILTSGTVLEFFEKIPDP